MNLEVNGLYKTSINLYPSFRDDKTLERNFIHDLPALHANSLFFVLNIVVSPGNYYKILTMDGSVCYLWFGKSCSFSFLTKVN